MRHSSEEIDFISIHHREIILFLRINNNQQPTKYQPWRLLDLIAQQTYCPCRPSDRAIFVFEDIFASITSIPACLRNKRLFNYSLERKNNKFEQHEPSLMLQVSTYQLKCVHGIYFHLTSTDILNESFHCFFNRSNKLFTL